MSDLAVIGLAAWDRNLRIGALPAPGQATRLTGEFANPGGRAQNTAAVAATLGCATTFIGAADDSPAARDLRAHLDAVEGLTGLLAGTDAPLTQITVLLTADGQRTFLTPKVTDAHFAAPDRDSVAAVSDAQIAWVDTPAALRGRWWSCAASTRRALPLQHLHAEVAAGRQWGLTVGSVDDIDGLTSETLHASGVTLAVMTEGASGGSWWTPATGWSRYVSAPAATLVDTCGAGDAFCAGLLAALCDGASDTQALAAASRAGADAVARPGSWPHPGLRPVAATHA